MSKRLCISLVHAPPRSHASLRQCSLQTIFTTVRGDTHRQHRTQRRPFSSSQTHHVGPQRMVPQRKQAQPSMAVAMKKQQAEGTKSGVVLEHAGLLPGTFIPPTGKNLPAWTLSWRDRLRLERYRLNNVWAYISSLWIARFMITPKLKLERAETPQIAKQLYEEMYGHLASGNLQPLEQSVSTSLMSSLRARVAQRPQNTSYRWTLHKYYAKPKCVSYIFAMFPEPKGKTEKMGIIQSVIRIKSRQSLLKVERRRVKDWKTGKVESVDVPVDDAGQEIADHKLDEYKNNSAKDTTEYVVLQRFVRKSKPGPWHIWGMAPESSLKSVRANLKKMEEQRAMQMKA